MPLFKYVTILKNSDLLLVIRISRRLKPRENKVLSQSIFNKAVSPTVKSSCLYRYSVSSVYCYQQNKAYAVFDNDNRRLHSAKTVFIFFVTTIGAPSLRQRSSHVWA
ncbi:hypothetical protein NPIL_174081 [Nephila pilipes]|uniref:Uncharacterized protein n=1 Tax=Nephila pilipes TaxID=299642 RepID=A0A8X6TCW3_NEPPI|nr:hypothetical protein NPIL_174081 [Nephila pilipes]